MVKKLNDKDNDLLNFRNRFSLLFLLNKKKLSGLYKELQNYIENNENYRFTDDYKPLRYDYYFYHPIAPIECIDNYREIENIPKHNRLFIVKPKDLNESIECIILTIFNLSSDYIGLSFSFWLKQNVVDQINENNQPENFASENYLNRSEYTSNFIYLINQLKKECFDYIKSNFITLKSNDLIFLDEYDFYLSTTVQSLLLSLYGLYDCYNPDYKLDVFFDLDSKNYVSLKYCFRKDLSSDLYSYNLLYKLENFNQKVYISDEFLINVYIYILNSYCVDKYKEQIEKKRNALKDFYIKQEIGKYKLFIDMNREINEIKDGIYISEVYCYENNILYREFRLLNEKYNQLDKKNDLIESEYSNILNINNLIYSYGLSIIAIIIAIFSLLYDVFKNEQTIKIAYYIFSIVFNILF